LSTCLFDNIKKCGLLNWYQGFQLPFYWYTDLSHNVNQLKLTVMNFLHHHSLYTSEEYFKLCSCIKTTLLVCSFVYPFSYTRNTGHINYSLQFVYYKTTHNIWTPTQYIIRNTVQNLKNHWKWYLSPQIAICVFIYLYLGVKNLN
jgi:hypothetical protein